MKKKIVFDSILNIVSTAVPIAIIQLLIYPYIAKKLGNAEYGLIITLVSLFNLFSHPFGNVLNNIRLLQNNEYKQENIEGDFNILLVFGLMINSIIMVIGIIYYEGRLFYQSVLLIVLISGFNLIREYLIVAFRINLNYKFILLNNIFLIIGYLIGFLLFIFIGYWQLIFLCGYVISTIFIIKKSNLIREKFVITKLFRRTAYKSFILFFSTLLKSVILYADKLIIYPLIGPVAVSVYYSATVLGKIISIGVTPISSVFLSYLTNIKEVNLINFFKILSISSIVGIVGFFIGISVSEPLLFFLYPDWALESIKLIKVTTASSVIGVMGSIISPIILRYNNVNWQLTLSITEIIIYITFTVVFYKMYGLIGFCLGILFTNIIKVIIMIIVYVMNYNEYTT